jgi:galactofuranose transport system substrate-binding protein
MSGIRRGPNPRLGFGAALLLAASMLFLSCTRETEGPAQVKYLIGVSQANLSEPWRIAMCEDIKAEAARHKDIRVVFSDASDSTQKQIEDVRHFLSYKVDLLIISPIDSLALTPVVTEAYRTIPVILLDRAVEGFDYTLFIGPDNLQIGREAGRYVTGLLGSSAGTVLEIQGRPGSPPTLGRSNGFNEIISKRKNITVLPPIGADWLKDRAEDNFLERMPASPSVDVVFAQNDSMAYGAYLAEQKAGRKNIKFIGIDGLPGPNGGIDLVRRGILAATFICPTGGKEAIEYGVDILNHREGIPKKIFLRTRKLTPTDLKTEKLPAPYVEATTKPAGKKIVIGFAQVGHESHWREANTVSIKEAVAKAGFDLRFVDCENDPAKQIQAVRDFIKRQVDIIAFSPIVESDWEPALVEAKAAGIPVILIDRAVDTKDDSLWVTYVGSDFLEEGRRAGRWVLDAMKDRGDVKIVELQGTRGSAPAIDRQIGFDETILGHPAFRIVRSESSDFTFEGGRTTMKRILKEDEGRIDVLFAHNDDMALGAIKSMEEAGLKPGRDIKIVSVDSVRTAFEAMIAGKLNCTVECTPLLGPQLVKAVQDYMAGKYLPIRIITSEGVFPAETARSELPNRKY